MRDRQPHRARAPGDQRAPSAALGAAAHARRRHLPRRLHEREPGRLLRRAEPRAADRGHRALLVAARRLRLPEAQQRDRGQRGRRGRCWARSRPSSRTAKGEAHARAAEMRLEGSGSWATTPTRRPLRATIRQDVHSMHGYAVQPSAGFVKVDTMENPFRLPPALRSALGERLAEVALNRYPAERGDVLRAELAQHAHMPDGCDIMLGNGSDELISLLTLAADVPGQRRPGAAARLRDVRDVGAAAGPEVRRRAADARLRARRRAMLAAVREHQPALRTSPTRTIRPPTCGTTTSSTRIIEAARRPGRHRRGLPAVRRARLAGSGCAATSTCC